MMHGSMTSVPTPSLEEGLIEELLTLTASDEPLSSEILERLSERLKKAAPLINEKKREVLRKLYLQACTSAQFRETPDWVTATSYALQGRVWESGKMHKDL